MNKHEPLTTITEIRKHKGITQQELAIKSKVNIGTIRALEEGINNPKQAKLSTLLAIAKALNVKLIHLFPDEKSIA